MDGQCYTLLFIELEDHEIQSNAANKRQSMHKKMGKLPKMRNDGKLSNQPYSNHGKPIKYDRTGVEVGKQLGQCDRRLISGK